MIRNYQNGMKGSTQESKKQGKEANSNSGIGTNEDLILQGLRILENLARDQHNCTEIYKTNGLLLKITSPVSSVNLVKDIENNAAWIKVVDGSLKVVSRLMGAPGDTGKKMCHQIAENNIAVRNLEAVLGLEINSNNLELQTRAIEVVEQLFFNDCTSLDREKREHFIDEESASRLKEKAGEALAMLSMGSRSSSEVIRSYTGCGRVVIHCLTEMLGSKTVIRSTSGTEDVETEIKKVLEELLQINTETQEQAGSRSTGNISAARRQDIENPPPTGSDQHEHATPRSHKQQSEERRLQAALLSLCAAIRTRCFNAGDFASVLEQLIAREDFVGKLKDIVEENRYATPACLAIQKLTCEMVTLLIPHDQRVEQIDGKKEIIDALSQASATMAGHECSMRFAGTYRDCHGVPVKPLFRALVEGARELQMNTSAGGP